MINTIFSNLSEIIHRDKDNYKSAGPFPHIVLDDFLCKELAQEIFDDFPKVDSEGWIHYLHYNESKHGLTKSSLMPNSIQKTIKYFNSSDFLYFLENLTGISNLLSDNSLEGGGLHQTLQGGKLNIHADFTVHTYNKKWQRRVNVILYLNKNWEESYNGHLELWDKKMNFCLKKVSPIFNRCVIFNTDIDSFHGVPDELKCPENMSRKSIALYYYTEEKNPIKNSTLYKAKPNDSIVKHVLVFLDTFALKLYTILKRALGFDDKFVSKLLSFFKKN